MKLEKTFHDEIQQILKLGSAIKVIPWTARASSRSKINHCLTNKLYIVALINMLLVKGFYKFFNTTI